MPANPNALKDAYSQFSNGGYSGSIKDFYSLLQSNPKAFEDSYNLFSEGGYNGTKNDYNNLLGLKETVTKKEEVKKEEPVVEEVKTEEEKPYAFKFAAEETEDETKPTSVLVPEGETDDTEQSESAKLMANYRLENESKEDFYKRITPISGTEAPMIFNFNENKYVPNEAAIGSPMSGVSSTTTIDNITKNNHGIYINQNNEPATEEEILKFEELTTLNNIHNEALKLKSNLAGEHGMSDSELLETFDKENFEKKKKEKVEKGLVDDNLNFDFESYLNYKTKKQQDGFANYLAKTNAPLTAEHQKEYNTLAESKLPAIQEGIIANYQSEIDNKQKSIVAKYQKQADNATSQEEIDSLNKKLKNELDVAMQPIYDKVNKDINDALKNDKDINALDEKYQTKYESLQEKQWGDYVENWRPKSKHFSEEELNGIGKELDKNGFAHANGPEKKAMLHKMLSNLVGMQGDIPDSHTQEIKNEYWTHFYDKLAFTPTEDGQVYSQFVLKDIATGALKSAQDKLKEEAKKYKPKVIQRAGTGIVPGSTYVRTPEQQALADNKHLAMTIDYSQQVLDNPESASDTGIVNFFRGLTSLQGHKYIPVTGGLVDLNKSFNLYNLAKKENRTKEEEQALQLYAIKNASDKQVKELSTGYNAGAIAGESLSFMGEIILTSGVYSGIKKSVQVGVKKALDKQIKKRVKKEIGKKVTGGLRFKKGTSEMLFVPKNATYKVVDKVGDAIGFIAATGAQTSTMPQRYLTGTFENMTPEIAFAYTDQADDLLNHIELTALVGSKDDPQLKDGDDFGKAFSKAFGTTWAEYATERMGELLPGLGKSALAKVGITESPEWLKRMSLGIYLRKMGLNKAEAFDHFAKNQAGWNGVLGEMSEEFINIPLSNLINGNDLTEGFEEQSIKEMGISIGATSLAFGGGSVLYNNTMGKTNPTIFVRGQRQADGKSAMAYLKKLKKEGKLNEDTDIEIRNDWVVFDEVSKFLEDNGLSNEMIKTGGTDISEGHIVASEVEVMDEIDDPNQRERLGDIDQQINDKEQELDTLNEFKRTKKSKREEEQNLTEIDRVTKEIEVLKSEADAIKAPVKEKIIKRKKTEAYVKGLANLKSIMEEEGIDPEVLQEAKNLEEARQMLTDKLLEQSNLRQEGDKYFDTKTGDEVELTPEDKKLLKDQVEEGITSHGAFTVDPKTGKKTIIINRDAALKGGGANVAGHEFLHYFLAETVNKHPELKLALGQALSTYIYNIDPRQIRDTDFRKRVETYQQTPPSRGGGSIVAMDETLTILADAMANGTYQYNETAMTKIGDIIRRIMSSFGVAVEFGEGRDVFNFIRDYNRAFAKGKLSEGLRKTMAEGAVITGQVKEFATDYKSRLDEFNKKINPEGLPDQNLTLEDLDGMGMLFSKDQRDEFSDQAESAKKILIPYGEDMENFDPNSNIITKQLPGMIKAQAAKFMAAGVKIDLPELIQDVQVNMLLKGDRNFDGRGDLYGHLNGRIKFRILDAFNNNPLVVEDFSQTQLDEARAQLDKEALDNLNDVETTESETPRTKVNVLKFQKVDNKVDNIRKIVKVKKGDTFKEITDKHTGKVGEEIFDVPETKITDPKKNLTYAKNIVNGIPEPSEAGNIQDFYRVGNNMEKLIKILPKYNVSSKDTDINEVGENIQVSRETSGRGLGLKNRVLKYFYEPVIGPNGKQKRSSGKTSQVPLWRLKQEFVNPTSEIIEKAKQDLGITPVGQLNNYDRTIGQFLKGLAFFQGQQTSLSTAQRILYPEAIKGTTEEQAVKKRQIADITAAQGGLAFSKDVNRIVNLRSTFELETKGIDKLLKIYGIKNTFDLKTKKGIDKFVENVKTQLLPLMPKEFWFGKGGGTVFTGSSKVLGTTDAAKKLYKEYYKPAINNLANDPDVKFGKQIKGVKDFSISAYSTIFKDAKTIKTNLKNGKIDAWNKKVALIHGAMWKRFSKAIKKNKNNAIVIGSYLKMTGSDTKHWHKRGAQFIGYSKTITGKRFEYEHAMPATAAYLYLIDASLSNANFDVAYEIVMDNYKLIALDKAMDKKLTTVGLQRRMPKNWDLLDNKWWDRYFNEQVAVVKGGIDPTSLVFTNGKTFAEQFNINVEGKAQPLKPGINKAKTLNKAVNKAILSSFSKDSKGVTVLDFDDTLATTKSLVRYTAPGGTTGTLNAEEYASQYQDLSAQGYKFDFTDFNKVVKAKLAPLFNKALKLQKKFGPENMFILTARPLAAQKAIFDFLKANGLNIPMENISALGNSTAEAKALWIAEKVGEGYNDFYFADDALQNVQAVKNMLDQFDVKSKVQQAKSDFVHGDPQVVKSIEEASKNDIKDIGGLANPGTYNNIRFSKDHRGEYENTISKHRPDLVKERLVSKTVDGMFKFIDNLNVPINKKRKYEQITTKWLATSNVKLGEDSYKIQQAVEIAEKYKEDIFSYRNPNEIIEKYASKIKKKPLDPSKTKEFTFSGEHKKRGITVYEVQNTKEGQQAVRDIVNTHWGIDSNPWCITKAKKGKLTEDAWLDWTAYEKGPKRIIFQDGKLSSFYANRQYWDRMDNATDGPTISIKEGRVTKKVELVDVGDGKIEESTREARTVSKDKKTVTTEVFAESQDGYIEGTKIIENRVKGKTIKSTRYNPDGKIVEIKEFNKDGKATASYNFFPDGKMSAVNNWGQPFGDMSTNDVVMKKGDVLNHQHTEGDIAYMYGRVKLNDQVTEIGWAPKEKNSDLKNVIKTVDGKVRVDLKKVLKLDPDAKGIPKKISGKSVIMFSKDGNLEFNEMLERTKGLPSDYKISQAKAKQRGKKKGRYKFWIPPSADDFAGLLMAFQGKGKQGIADAAWLKEKLLDPYAKGDRDLNSARQMTAMEFKALRKQFPKVSKKLRKIIPTGDYNYGDAMRVYLWDKAGMEIPGLSNTDKQNMLDLVAGDPELQAFADVLGEISRKEEGYIAPDEYWMTKDIVADITEDGIIGDGRKEHFVEWKENKDIIFSPENMNKIEFIYGSNFREALEDMLYRMENGSNRPTGQNRIVNNFINWLNGGISVVMNWNSRSAVLQTLSTVNFINWGDNNVASAAKAFANQKQFWKDFAFIFNSDMLRQRRAGLKTTIESNELMSEVEGSVNPARAAIRYLLRVGFTPTKIADSFAIAMGGSTFYRNRIKTYLKQGMTQTEAEAKAWLDFQEAAEETQQSSRPDRISMQQASVLGRLILAFQNTPMQYMRLSKKEILNIVNGRYEGVTGPNSLASKVGKIAYYTAIQNLIFYSMQSALFAMMFSDDEDDEEFFKQKKHRVADNMADGVLRGLGVHGAVIATIKNIILKRAAGDRDSILVEALKVSPPLSIKARQLLSADRTLRWDKDIMKEMETFDIDNPMWNAMFNVIEFATNLPLARMETKYKNVRESLNKQHEAWQRIAFLLGWAPWNFGIKNKQIEEVKEEIKTQKTYERKKKQKIKKVEKQAEEQAKIDKQIAKEKELQEKGLLVDPKCRHVSTKGKRCRNSVANAGDACTIHEEVKQRTDGKKIQCKKIKSDGKKCKMKTSAKSGLCYYHD